MSENMIERVARAMQARDDSLSTASSDYRWAQLARAAIDECWREINSLIVPGPLPGNGTDRVAQRNGLILAANVLADALARPMTDREKMAEVMARAMLKALPDAGNGYVYKPLVSGDIDDVLIDGSVDLRIVGRSALVALEEAGWAVVPVKEANDVLALLPWNETTHRALAALRDAVATRR